MPEAGLSLLRRPVAAVNRSLWTETQVERQKSFPHERRPASEAEEERRGGGAKEDMRTASGAEFIQRQRNNRSDASSQLVSKPFAGAGRGRLRK